METLDAIRRNPQIARFKFRAVNLRMEGTHSGCDGQGLLRDLQEDTSCNPRSLRDRPSFDKEVPPGGGGPVGGTGGGELGNPCQYLIGIFFIAAQGFFYPGRAKSPFACRSRPTYPSRDFRMSDAPSPRRVPRLPSVAK